MESLAFAFVIFSLGVALTLPVAMIMGFIEKKKKEKDMLE